MCAVPVRTFGYMSFLLLSLSIRIPPNYSRNGSKLYRRFTLFGRGLFLLVYAHGHLPVTRIENKHRMVARLFRLINKISMNKILRQTIFLIFSCFMLQSTIVQARVRMGTKTLSVGETVRLEVANSYQTATGSWKITEGSSCVISARATKSCKIWAIRAGKCTVTWTGVIDAGWVEDYYWDITVEGGNDDDKSISIDERHFPDANFRDYLLGRDFGKDGVITQQELEFITTIDVSGEYSSPGKIVSLQGIEFFTFLTRISCSWNQLTSLDVSNNSELRFLNCNHNQLSSLDISNNAELKFLYCNMNQLSSLDISRNTALTDIECYNNQLATLDLSKNTKLEHLFCNDNQLTSLIVSPNCALTGFTCYRNQIKGKAMDEFIKSLPYNESSVKYELYLICDRTVREGSLHYEADGNECTRSQVNDLKAKGWIPYSMGFLSDWQEYAGSDPTRITGILMEGGEAAPIYNLNGQHISKPRKGINIIGGKKVVVK